MAKKLSVTWALITGLKMYDRGDAPIIRSLITGLELRSILNFLYGLGLTPHELDRLTENESVCPEMQG